MIHYAAFVPSAPSVFQNLSTLALEEHDPHLIKAIHETERELGPSGVEFLWHNRPEVFGKSSASSSSQSRPFVQEPPGGLSPKFEQLVACLKSISEEDSDVRGIIMGQ